VKIAVLPRSQAGGWLAPTAGAIEFLQHLTQVSAHPNTLCSSDGSPADLSTFSASTPSLSMRRRCLLLSRSCFVLLEDIWCDLQYLVVATQAVPLAARRNPGAFKGVVEGNAPLLQLPHVDADILRKLFRKKLRTLAEMQAAESKERRDALLSAGLTSEQVHTARQHACKIRWHATAFPSSVVALISTA